MDRVIRGTSRPDQSGGEPEERADTIHRSGQRKAHGRPMPLGGGVQFDSLLVNTVVRGSCLAKITATVSQTALQSIAKEIDIALLQRMWGC